MIKFCKKTDKLTIIAPSSACFNRSGQMCIEASRQRLQDTIAFYSDHGFQCIVDPTIFSASILGYFAAPKRERLRQLQQVILDPKVKIIAAFRGGYGTTELVFNCLNIRPTVPKTLIGFSDITTLHFLFNQQYHLPTIHGAMSTGQMEMLDEVVNVLGGKMVTLKLTTLNRAAQSFCNMNAKIVGGNLALICNLIGTKLQPDLRNKIFFIEDINEPGYRIHRSLVHMYNAGLFDHVKAIIFGEFSNSDNNVMITLREFISSYLSYVPTFFTEHIGHGKVNMPIVIGGHASIDQSILKIQSPFKTN